jgi:signal transduction histidine kinase
MVHSQGHTKVFGETAAIDARENELSLKTAQLLQLRIAFAVVGLLLALALTFVATAEYDLRHVVAIAFAVIVYSALALAALKMKWLNTVLKIKCFNGLLIGFDIVSVTVLVHFTLGFESDLYVLYLLPILLSSYTFSNPGIYATSFFVSMSYVALLLIENADSLVALSDASLHGGLAGAYLQKLWAKILARSAILVSFSFIWGGFCGYISDLAQQVTKKLREQLAQNEALVGEVKAQAARQKLINSINSTLLNTLELDVILHTAVQELCSALAVPACAIVCPGGDEADAPRICQFIRSVKPAPRLGLLGANSQFFPEAVCQFLLVRKSHYERDFKGGGINKTFVIDTPENAPELADIKQPLTSLRLESLIVQPIIYGDQSEGIILIASQTAARNWSNSELELIRAVAGQVAVAIENAKLVEQLSKTNESLRQKNLNLDAKNLELCSVQSQLVHQEKMASLGRLVAGIAHELNNPINFVHGNLPYLKEYCQDLKKIIAALESGDLQDKQSLIRLKQELKYDFLVTDLDNILADLTEGTERIRHIIKNLRSFSRLDEAELKDASINEGIESTLKILSQYYGRDKIAAATDFADLPEILCYPGQLNQVWMNLLSNAAEAVAGRAEPLVKISTHLKQNEVLVTISDNGPGIRPDVESKIFEPFFTTKPVGQGTGLGLSICHSIVERHGGKIWFESDGGQGTTFRVSLPIKAKSQALSLPESEENNRESDALSNYLSIKPASSGIGKEKFD